MLIEPGAQVSRGCRAGIGVCRARITGIGRAGGCRTLISGTGSGCGITGRGTLHRVSLRLALILRPRVLNSAGLGAGCLRWACGSMPGRRGMECGRASALAPAPGRGHKQQRDQGRHGHLPHRNRVPRIVFPGHWSSPAPAPLKSLPESPSPRCCWCWRALPTDPAVGRCCPAFANHAPRRLVPEDWPPGSSR